MLYLFTGDDAKARSVAYEKFLKTMPSGMETFFFGRNDFNRVELENLYLGSGLFSPKSLVILSGILSEGREETKEFIFDALPLMADSQNNFIFLEGKLNKPVVDAFKKSKTEINIFEQEKVKKERFDNFMIANAFANKDKLNVWIYFRQSIERGAALEEIAGILFWKMKDMLVRRNFGKFSEAELKNSAMHLSYLLPKARREGHDAESAFEQFLLTSF